jgi:hypothetical protein
VVVGSAISTLIEQHVESGDAVAAVGGLVGAFKDAMRAAQRNHAGAGGKLEGGN